MVLDPGVSYGYIYVSRLNKEAPLIVKASGAFETSCAQNGMNAFLLRGQRVKSFCISGQTNIGFLYNTLMTLGTSRALSIR